MTQRLKKKRMLSFGIYTDLYNFLRRLKGRIEDVPELCYYQGYICRLRMKGFHSSSRAFPIKKHCFNSSMEFINTPHVNRNKLLARVWLLERHDRSSSLILPTNKHTGDLTYSYLDILSFIGSLTDKLSGFRE